MLDTLLTFHCLNFKIWGLMHAVYFINKENDGAGTFKLKLCVFNVGAGSA